MSDEFVSKLPAYEVKRSKNFPSFLIVMCGRKDCPGTKAGRPFLVSEREWMRPFRVQTQRQIRPLVIIGRSCPYCMKAGRIPKRSEIG
jgi:hypothetical protein